MDLEKLSSLAENLRKEVIGDPVWNAEKRVFEYEDQSIEVVAILKLLRGIQGVRAQEVLCQNGLFIDMGAIYRCVSDCSDEIYFLLEEYPAYKSKCVKQFVQHFFEHTIDGIEEAGARSVPKKKIHASRVRMLSEHASEKSLRDMLEKPYKTFCGYIHANYAHIMQNYGGQRPDLSFNILGIPSDSQKTMNMQMAQLAYASMLLSMMFVCRALKQGKMYLEAKELLDNEKK